MIGLALPRIFTTTYPATHPDLRSSCRWVNTVVGLAASYSFVVRNDSAPWLQFVIKSR
jgi:hypothetical protein